MKQYIIFSLYIIGYLLLFFGIIFFIVGICEVEHPYAYRYNLSTKCTIFIALGLACFLSHFFVLGFNIIVQAAVKCLDSEKNIDKIDKKHTKVECETKD